MWSCVLCNEEYVIVSSLCPACNKIKKLCHLYSRDTVYNILDNVLLRNNAGINKKTKDESTKFPIKSE